MMRQRMAVLGGILSASILMLTGILPTTDPAFAQLGPSDSQTIPKNAEYVGLTKCAACHFDQYKDWKTSEHGKAFEILPAKYKKNADCLKCHATGFDQLTVKKNSFYQSGVSCEACHGPGEDHAKFALTFVNELITEKGLQTLRSKIHRLDLGQCVKCHMDKGHKKHPPFDREAEAPRPSQKQSANFFQSVHENENVVTGKLR